MLAAWSRLKDEQLYTEFLEKFRKGKSFNLKKSGLIKFQNTNKFLACHAGIGPGMKTLQDINETNRFEEPGMDGVLCDILWSDPRRKGC